METDLELLRHAQAGDLRARNELVTRHLGMVGTIAGRARPGAAFDDAFQDGAIGLIKAIGRFDPGAFPGVPFASYAGWWVRESILAAKRLDMLVRVPKGVRDLERKRDRGEALSRRERETVDLGKAVAAMVSDGDVVLIDPGELPEEVMIRREEADRIRVALGTIRPADAEVLAARAGLDRDGPEPVKDIAARLRINVPVVVASTARGLDRLACALGIDVDSPNPRRRIA